MSVNEITMAGSSPENGCQKGIAPFKPIQRNGPHSKGVNSMKIFEIISIASMLSAISLSPAYASDVSAGIVTNLQVERGGAAFVQTSGNHAGEWPVCAQQFSRHVINTNTLAGQAVYSTILAAALAGKKIIIYGTGTCTDWPDSENIQFVGVVPQL